MTSARARAVKAMYYSKHPNEKDDIGWVIDILMKYSRTARNAFRIGGLSIYNGRQINSTSRIGVDKEIMICVKCNSCWEHGTTPGERDYYIYDDFPRLGKRKKVICPPCAKQ